MLAQMTAKQFAELLLYFQIKSEEKETARATAQDANLKDWLTRKVKAQKSKKAG